MNRRITKAMAFNAATKIKNKVYGRKIENAIAKVNAAVEELVLKYIPAPVIYCVNEYPDYFNTGMHAFITTIIYENNTSFTSCSIEGKLTFKVPYFGRHIKVDRNEYDALLKLDSKRMQLENECDELGDQVNEALIALRTEKAVEKDFPEAIEYLEFPEVKAVPMPVFTGLREIIQSNKEED